MCSLKEEGSVTCRASHLPRCKTNTRPLVSWSSTDSTKRVRCVLCFGIEALISWAWSVLYVDINGAKSFKCQKLVQFGTRLDECYTFRGKTEERLRLFVGRSVTKRVVQWALINTSTLIRCGRSELRKGAGRGRFCPLPPSISRTTVPILMR